MGLRKVRHFLGRVAPDPGWPVALSIASLSVLAQIGGDSAREWLRFDRTAIAAGEVRRLLTGHFVHLGWSHAAMNVAGLVLIWLLVGGLFTSLQWLIVGLVSILIIDAGFWLKETQLEWYVGLSGLLHGILAAGVVRGLGRSGAEAWFLGAVLALKIGYEQFAGPLPGSASAAGGPVIVNAHLYGAIGGAIAALLLHRSAGRAASI